MKCLIIATLLLISAGSVQAQGQLNFANYAASLFAPITDSANGGMLADGTNYLAVLYVAPANTSDKTLFIPIAQTPLLSGLGAGYFLGSDEFVPGVAPLTIISVLVRAFDFRTGSDYSTATHSGESEIFQVVLGGGIQPSPNLYGLKSFSIGVVPEPLTVTLLGGLAMLVFLRQCPCPRKV